MYLLTSDSFHVHTGDEASLLVTQKRIDCFVAEGTRDGILGGKLHISLAFKDV